MTPIERILAAYVRSGRCHLGRFLWRASFPWTVAFISDAALADAAERLAERYLRGLGDPPL